MSVSYVDKSRIRHKCDLRLDVRVGTKIDKPTLPTPRPSRTEPKSRNKGYAVTCKLNMGQYVQIKGRKAGDLGEERVVRQFPVHLQGRALYFSARPFSSSRPRPGDTLFTSYVSKSNLSRRRTESIQHLF
jgi:hypothetical protein